MKHDIAPWTRHEPNQPFWASLQHHPPERGKPYLVRETSDGPSSLAYLTYSEGFKIIIGEAQAHRITEYWTRSPTAVNELLKVFR